MTFETKTSILHCLHFILYRHFINYYSILRCKPSEYSFHFGPNNLLWQ
uniref:Macaca fascicularis brain cDNA clone: QflA-19043, similar to human hypothetical protein FLJ13611 (FLJ13611), mRNA, RefSeq: NM_024941.1 n=1 Tax=Macaca fascicularis TaxID=9541 RepID=I7GLP5_MACFA|nr:unnamed protein product [Macaca fascicularis]